LKFGIWNLLKFSVFTYLLYADLAYPFDHFDRCIL